MTMSILEQHRDKHPMCAKCWIDLNGMKRKPNVNRKGERAVCCFCGGTTLAGIFVDWRPGAQTLAFCPDLLVDPMPVLPVMRWGR